jgi:hypothetical protein
MSGKIPPGLAAKTSLQPRRTVVFVPMLGFWVFVALVCPGSSWESPLALGIAVAASALLVALALSGLPTLPARTITRHLALGRRARARRLPRSLDPDAAGRPRPRAPSTRFAF